MGYPQNVLFGESHHGTHTKDGLERKETKGKKLSIYVRDEGPN